MRFGDCCSLCNIGQDSYAFFEANNCFRRNAVVVAAVDDAVDLFIS